MSGLPTGLVAHFLQSGDSEIGWRSTHRAFSCLILGLAALCACLMRDRPESVGQRYDGDDDGPGDGVADEVAAEAELSTVPEDGVFLDVTDLAFMDDLLSFGLWAFLLPALPGALWIAIRQRANKALPTLSPRKATFIGSSWLLLVLLR